MVPKLQGVIERKSPLAAIGLGAMLVLGCAKAPNAKECRSSSDCSLGQSCALGVCQEDLSLAFRSPSQPVITNGSVSVEVAATGIQPAAVELQIDGAAVETLAPPFTGILDTATFPEGKHDLTAVAWEGARQFSSQPVSVTVDRTAPAAPSIAAASPTRAAPVLASGSAEAGATLRVFEAGAQVGADAVAAEGGAWSASLPLAEGAHVLTATATDPAGNTSAASEAISVLVDCTAPAAPTVTAASPTRASPVVIGGSAEPGSTVRLLDGASQAAPDIAAAADGTWSASLELAEGPHSFTATATDPAGNTSIASAIDAVVVDRTAPAAPSIAVASPTRANPVSVGGSAEAGATVHLFEGSAQAAPDTVAAQSGSWSASLNLAEGTHSFTATATDAVGNTSAASAVATVVVDRTAPSVLSMTPASGATNIWSRDPIVVKFSEAILASSVASQSVAVQASGLAVLLKSTALSDDGKTLTLVPDPAWLPPVPATATASLSGLTNLAGNPLPFTQWSWELPEWQEPANAFIPGDFVDGLASAVGPDGVTFVAWSGDMGVGHVPITLVQIGTQNVIGTPPRARSSKMPASFAVDSTGRIVIAYCIPSTASPSGVQVSRYEASAWVNLGDPVSSNGTGPILMIDGADRPVVLWSEPVGSVKHLFAKRWNGSGWDSVLTETPTGASIDVTSYAMTVGSGDTVAVAYVRSDMGLVVSSRPMSQWPAAAPASATNVAIAGEPGAEIVAYTDAGAVHVVKPVSGYIGSWKQIGANLAPGGNLYLVSRPSASIDAQLVLGFGTRDLVGWDGSSWHSMSSGLGAIEGALTGSAVLAANQAGAMSFSWNDD